MKPGNNILWNNTRNKNRGNEKNVCGKAYMYLPEAMAMHL